MTLSFKEADLPKETAEPIINKELMKPGSKLTKDINGVDDEKIFKMMLQEQDERSEVAWTKEDPRLDKIKEMIAKMENGKN